MIATASRDWMGRREQLTVEEREVILRELSKNRSARFIAAALGRHHSTISREIERNGGEEDGDPSRLPS
ncbi:helix-turn-helix domain-containing protein [Parafrankia sp. FMc2]|uniref:helix-turn-helix domain-containing protein n=1 Tax=Parafrankia sp. FMc2 TaxID=3233196 RepID=UPI0034D6C244